MSNLYDLDTMILRDTTNPPLTNKGSELTYGEFDGNFIEIYNAIQDIVNGANIPAYDAGATYDQYSTDPKDKFVLYNSRIWKATYNGSPSTFTGQTPAEGSYWTQISLAQMLGNPVALTKIAEAFDDTLDASNLYETAWQSSTSKTLFASPVAVTGGDAPAAGYAKVPVALLFGLDAGGVAYDFGGNGIYLAYSTAPTTRLIQVAQASINAAADVYKNLVPATNNNYLNDDFVIASDADANVGTGTYWFKVIYRKIALPF